MRSMDMNRETNRDSENENNNSTTTSKELNNDKNRRTSLDIKNYIENLYSTERCREKYLQRINKIKRNNGQAYYTQKGKFVPEKQFKYENCNCRSKFIERVSEKQCKELFDNFWKLGNYNLQNIFLHTNILQQPVKRRRSKSNSGSKRKYSYNFYLHSFDKNVLVCKKFFINTFQISVGRINCLLRSGKKNPIDKRGKMEDSRRTITEEHRDAVIDHINSYSVLEDHYAREENPGQKFLTPELTIIEMYNSYLQKCKENNINSVVSRVTYTKILKKSLNYYFGLPR